MLAEHRLSQGLFMKVHRARSHSLQMSSAAAFVFSEEFSIIDANQQNSSDSFQVFMVETPMFVRTWRKMTTLLKSVMPQTRNRKAGKKSGTRGAKKATARGSRGKNIKGSKENALHREAKKTSDDSMDKEDSKERDK